MLIFHTKNFVFRGFSIKFSFYAMVVLDSCSTQKLRGGGNYPKDCNLLSFPLFWTTKRMLTGKFRVCVLIFKACLCNKLLFIRNIRIKETSDEQNYWVTRKNVNANIYTYKDNIKPCFYCNFYPFFLHSSISY